MTQEQIVDFDPIDYECAVCDIWTNAPSFVCVSDPDFRVCKECFELGDFNEHLDLRVKDLREQIAKMESPEIRESNVMYLKSNAKHYDAIAENYRERAANLASPEKVAATIKNMHDQIAKLISHRGANEKEEWRTVELV